jgi:hypothetical protein
MCEKVKATMSQFELVEPGTLGEVLALRDAADPAVRPIAGGTALMADDEVRAIPAAWWQSSKVIECLAVPG